MPGKTKTVYVADIQEKEYLDIPLLPEKYNPFHNAKKRQLGPSLAYSARGNAELFVWRMDAHDAVVSIFPKDTVFESDQGLFRCGTVTEYIIDEEKAGMSAEEYVEEHFLTGEDSEILLEYDRDDQS